MSRFQRTKIGFKMEWNCSVSGNGIFILFYILKLYVIQRKKFLKKFHMSSHLYTMSSFSLLFLMQIFFYLFSIRRDRYSNSIDSSQIREWTWFNRFRLAIFFLNILRIFVVVVISSYSFMFDALFELSASVRLICSL